MEIQLCERKAQTTTSPAICNEALMLAQSKSRAMMLRNVFQAASEMQPHILVLRKNDRLPPNFV